MEEKSEVQVLVADFGRVARMLDSVKTVKAGGPDAVEALDAALKRLPQGDTIGQAVEDLRRRGEDIVKRARMHRGEAFRRAEAEFIRSVRDDGRAVRELDSGWRIGCVELEVQREQGRIQFRYNHQVVQEWAAAGSREEIQRLEESALACLKKAAIVEASLAAVFWDAYTQARRRHPQGSVPMTEFYPEVRIALVRRELAERKPDMRLTSVDLPRWAFLYNVDRYRALRNVPSEQRLAFEPGNQAETRRIGMPINGLDARQDTRMICYVRAVGAGR